MVIGDAAIERYNQR